MLAKLEELGVVESYRENQGGHPPLMVKRYQMPIRIHIAWCEWCARSFKEDEPTTEGARRMSEVKVTDDGVVVLPDGSGAFIGSFPLRKTHWIFAEHENVPPMPMQIGAGAERDALAKQIREAARFAIRASTMNGTEMDFDPDAMVQNMIVGLLGYWTMDGSHGGGLPPDGVRRRDR